MSKIRLMVADDHALIREGIHLYFKHRKEIGRSAIEVVAEAKDGDEALKITRDVRPDVLVLDTLMPRLTGYQVLRRVTIESPQTKVLLLGPILEMTRINHIKHMGAAGYLSKHIGFAKLEKAIRTVHEQNVFVTLAPALSEKIGVSLEEFEISERETEILKMVAHGHTNGEIAGLLNLSIKTIESNKTRINEKLGFNNRAAMVTYAIRRGWLNE